MKCRLFSLLAILSVGLMVCLGAAPMPRVQAVVLTGAGLPGGLRFASMGRAATNERGSVCFLAGWQLFCAMR